MGSTGATSCKRSQTVATHNLVSLVWLDCILHATRPKPAGSLTGFATAFPLRISCLHCHAYYHLRSHKLSYGRVLALYQQLQLAGHLLLQTVSRRRDRRPPTIEPFALLSTHLGSSINSLWIPHCTSLPYPHHHSIAEQSVSLGSSTMASSTATLRHTILVIAFIAGATAQQQQGGVSWETAPECPDSGSGTAVDTEGRSWGWYNGQSCKHSRSPPQNAALTAAQQQQQSWDAAPPCKYQLTADNGRADAQGRLWGWQDGRSCRHTGSISSSPPITPSSPSPPPSPALAWEAAPPCSYQATVANSRVDALGRYWGWQTGVGSCRFDQPPKVTPPPSPSPPAASPDPASPAPLRAPVPPSPVPTKQQPVPTVPGKTVGTSPAPGEEVIPVPAVEGEWHVGHLVVVHGFENFSGSNTVGCGANTVRNDAVQHTAVHCSAEQHNAFQCVYCSVVRPHGSAQCMTAL